MKNKRLISFVLFAALVNISVFPQSIDDFIGKYKESNGQGYVQPFADVFGASFNTGLFHNAMIKKMGFQAYLGVVTTAAFIPDKRKTFMATTEGNFTPVKTEEVPTILGPADPVEVSGDGGTVYVFPGGLNASMLPFAVPQLTLGSVFGTDVTVRYYAYSVNDDIGKLNLLSLGIRHSISQYFSALPLDLAVGFYRQQFKLGDIIDFNSLMATVQASKMVKIFTFYGGLGYENSKMKIEYTNQDDDTNISFDLTGSNNIRFTAGLTFNFGPVKLNVDYNLASQSVLCAGLGIGIGDKK